MTPKLPTQPTTNSLWFKQRLTDRGMSLRALARYMEMDPGAMSLTLRGKRRMTSAEANKIGQLLGVPVSEVLRQAGIPVQDDARLMPLSGAVSVEGKVTLFEKSAKENKAAVAAPADVPRNSLVLQIRTPGGLTDGWLIFCSNDKLIPETAIGRLAMISTGGQVVLGMLENGYDPAHYNILLSLPSVRALENAKVSWATPVLWIRPQ